MKVKVIEKCWYNETIYDPDTSVEDIIIEFKGKDIPSWAEPVEGAKVAKEPKEPEKGNGGGDDGAGEVKSPKVNELPTLEKNKILEEAKAVGIVGNHIHGWTVETLNAKIAAKKAEIGLAGGGE